MKSDGLLAVHSGPDDAEDGDTVGLFDKLFRRKSEDDDGEETVINLDADARRPQLLRLEQGLDALARAMRDVQTVENPGWRGRINEYSRLAGEASMMRRGTPTREGVLDLIFQIRPVFTGEPPAELVVLGPLQDEVLAAAQDLRDLRAGEKA